MPRQRDQEKQREYQRQWYLRNKAKRVQETKERKLGIREWADNYKAQLGCIRCGENHPACLDFHHRDPEQKIHDLAKAIHNGLSIKWLQEEIAKCDVLCANCHRKLHWQERTQV